MPSSVVRYITVIVPVHPNDLVRRDNQWYTRVLYNAYLPFYYSYILDTHVFPCYNNSYSEIFRLFKESNVDISISKRMNNHKSVSGAAVLSKSGTGPFITHITPGKIVDMGIKDANNMGAAMAPAALDTLITHFRDTGRKPSYYDLIITGDLGYIGKEILAELAETKGYNINANYNDCGVLIFDKQKQDKFVLIVDKILNITQTEDYLQNQEKQDAVKEYEKQIDIMVYKLYDLTYQEVKVIDPNFQMDEETYNKYKVD